MSWHQCFACSLCNECVLLVHFIWHQCQSGVLHLCIIVCILTAMLYLRNVWHVLHASRRSRLTVVLCVERWSVHSLCIPAALAQEVDARNIMSLHDVSSRSVSTDATLTWMCDHYDAHSLIIWDVVTSPISPKTLEVVPKPLLQSANTMTA